MTFSMFVGICSIVSTVIAVVTFILNVYDRKRK